MISILTRYIGTITLHPIVKYLQVEDLCVLFGTNDPSRVVFNEPYRLETCNFLLAKLI